MLQLQGDVVRLAHGHVAGQDDLDLHVVPRSEMVRPRDVNLRTQQGSGHGLVILQLALTREPALGVCEIVVSARVEVEADWRRSVRRSRKGG